MHLLYGTRRIDIRLGKKEAEIGVEQQEQGWPGGGGAAAGTWTPRSHLDPPDPRRFDIYAWWKKRLRKIGVEQEQGWPGGGGAAARAWSPPQPPGGEAKARQLRPPPL